MACTLEFRIISLTVLITLSRRIRKLKIQGSLEESVRISVPLKYY